MTEILMMNLTTTIRQSWKKKRASHPSSIRGPDIPGKLVDKLEQAEITMKSEKTEISKVN